MAKLARAFGWTTAEVRATTYRDLVAMADVLAEEARARKLAQSRAGRRR